jgi:helix-turn-helix protein
LSARRFAPCHTVPVCRWHNGDMPKVHYSRVIEEDPQDLKDLEKRHRYSHLFQRLRMLRLLKSGECRSLGEAANALGYSFRQCHRWFASYKKGGIEGLLVSRVNERGRQELVTPEAFDDLQEAMKRGEIASIAQAERFLSGSAMACATHTPMVWARCSGARRSSSRRVALATRRRTPPSGRPSKKVRRPDRGDERAPPGQAA